MQGVVPVTVPLVPGEWGEFLVGDDDAPGVEGGVEFGSDGSTSTTCPPQAPSQTSELRPPETCRGKARPEAPPDATSTAPVFKFDQEHEGEDPVGVTNPMGAARSSLPAHCC